MTFLRPLALAGAAAGLLGLSVASSQAAPLDTARAIASGAAPIALAQADVRPEFRGGGAFRGGGGGFRGGVGGFRGGYGGGFRGPYRGGYGYRGYYGPRYGYGYRRGYYGPGVGLGLGLATGAIVGGALAAQAAPPVYAAPPAYVEEEVVTGSTATADEVAACQARFKSYDPASGTYLGYDGQRHPCPAD